MTRVNWATAIVDIMIILIASQTTWLLLLLVFMTGGYLYQPDE